MDCKFSLPSPRMRCHSLDFGTLPSRGLRLLPITGSRSLPSVLAFIVAAHLLITALPSLAAKADDQLSVEVVTTYGTLGSERPARFISTERICLTAVVRGAQVDDQGLAHLRLESPLHPMLRHFPDRRSPYCMFGKDCIVFGLALPSHAPETSGPQQYTLRVVDELSGQSAETSVDYSLQDSTAFGPTGLHFTAIRDKRVTPGTSLGREVYLICQLNGAVDSTGKLDSSCHLEVLDSATGERLASQEQDYLLTNVPLQLKQNVQFVLFVNRPGDFILRLLCRNNITQELVTHDIPFFVSEDGPPPTPDFSVQSELRYGHMGPKRPDNLIYPGEIVPLAVFLSGLALDDSGVASFEVATSVVDSKGKPFVGTLSFKGQDRLNFGGSSTVVKPVFGLSRSAPPGEYVVEVEVTDLVSGKSSVTRQQVQLADDRDLGVGGFDIVTTDLEFVSGLAGDSAALQFMVNNAVAEDGACNVIATLDVLESATGELLFSRSFPLEKFYNSNREVAKGYFPIEMNRPGKFILRFTCEDTVTGQRCSRSFEKVTYTLTGGH